MSTRREDVATEGRESADEIAGGESDAVRRIAEIQAEIAELRRQLADRDAEAAGRDARLEKAVADSEANAVQRFVQLSGYCIGVAGICVAIWFTVLVRG